MPRKVASVLSTLGNDIENNTLDCDSPRIRAVVTRYCIPPSNDLLAHCLLWPPSATWSHKTHCDIVMNTHAEKDRTLQNSANLRHSPVWIKVSNIWSSHENLPC